MTRIGVGKFLIIFGVIWFIIWTLVAINELGYYYGHGGEIFSFGFITTILICIPGGECWQSGKLKIKAVKYSISKIEDNIRRAKNLVLEYELGTEFERALDSIRVELSDFYPIIKKYGEFISKILGSLEEMSKELTTYVEKKDRRRIKLQISTLRDRVADLRSELKR